MPWNQTPKQERPPRPPKIHVTRPRVIGPKRPPKPVKPPDLVGWKWRWQK